MVTRSMKRLVGMGFATVLGFAGAGAAYGVGDVLEVPAMETDLAAESLLLDVERTGERLVAVGERGHIVYSDDNGQSWKQADVPVSTTLTGVDFPDANAQQGWAVGHSGVILHSSDGGESWTHQFDGREGIPQVIAHYEQQITEKEAEIEAAEKEDRIADLEWELEGLVFTRDALKKDLKQYGPWEPLLDVWFENTEHGIAIGAYGHIYRTRNGGQSWQTAVGSINNPDRFHLNGITQVQGGDLYIAGEAGRVFRSTDKGKSWERVDPGYSGSFFGATGTGDGAVLVYGLRGNIYRSENGDEWRSVDAATSRTLNTAHGNGKGEIAMVGNDGAVVYSDDGGQSFSSHVRSARHSYLGVRLIPDGGLMLVGKKGTVRTDRQGRDLKR